MRTKFIKFANVYINFEYIKIIEKKIEKEEYKLVLTDLNDREHIASFETLQELNKNFDEIFD